MILVAVIAIGAFLKLAYLSSRTYGGFAKTPLNPEPYAYESGFSVKWLIEQQLQGDPALNYDPKKGPVQAPWLSWGPYLWDNGVIPRADGYHPEESDFAGDGTHHAGPGVEKMGALLLQFFKTDSTARPWFVRFPAAGPDPHRSPPAGAIAAFPRPAGGGTGCRAFSASRLIMSLAEGPALPSWACPWRLFRWRPGLRRPFPRLLAGRG